MKRAIVARGIRETTPAETPSGPMAQYNGAMFGFSGTEIQRATPEDFDETGQKTDQPAVFYSVSGSGKHTLSYPTDAVKIVEEEVFAAPSLAPVAFFGSQTAISAETAGNKLVRAGGWAGLVAGDVVAVADLGGANPAFFVAPVVAVDGDDLRLDAAWRTLDAVTGSATVKVYRSRRQRMGSTLLSSTWELFRSDVSSGEVYRGASHRSMQMSFAHPGLVTVSTSIDCLRKAEDTTSPLANPTAPVVAHPFYGSGIDFGNKLRPDAGLGFRYDGAPVLEAIVQKQDVSIERPRKLTGGAGEFGPQVINVDGDWTVRVSWSTLAAVSSADTEVPSWIAAAGRSEHEFSLAWGYGDVNGAARLYRCSKLQFGKAGRDPRESQGDQLAHFEAVASRKGAGDSLEIHDFAPPAAVTP